jgi:hypothetical protein
MDKLEPSDVNRCLEPIVLVFGGLLLSAILSICTLSILAAFAVPVNFNVYFIWGLTGVVLFMFFATAVLLIYDYCCGRVK